MKYGHLKWKKTTLGMDIQKKKKKNQAFAYA